MKFILIIISFIRQRPVPYAIFFWIFALIILAIIGNWAIMPVISGHFINTMPVPNIVNLEAEEAERVLAKAGLKAKWAKDGRYSNDIAANHVLIQMPAAGRTVKESRTVFLTLSKGRHEVLVPGLRGVSPRQAEISLQRLELLPGSKIEGAHSSMPKGVVIRTEPDSGQKVRVGSRINLIISSGKSSGKTLLPNLLDMSFRMATAVIDSLGFKVGFVSSMQLEDKLPNTVLDMSPKPGEYLDNGTEINLTVAE